MLMRGSKIFRQGGPGQSDKKSSDNAFFFFFFFSPQLILQKSNGKFQRNLSIFKVPEGVQHFPEGGSNFFQGGPLLLIPYRTHITFQGGGGGGGVRTPCPPSGSALDAQLPLFFIC